MKRVAVGVGIDRNRGDAHFAGRLDDATGDLASIGDQDFMEQSVPVMDCYSGLSTDTKGLQTLRKLPIPRRARKDAYKPIQARAGLSIASMSGQPNGQ
jgi:hypothetical protein